MRTCRTCSHIKTNGTKCGSPALRHQTLCYFHYQWDRRERRRVRLGGPVGTNKNTGIDFPILEGPESIMIALMEVQHALLDARIDRLTAHTLLYSLQLAMQLKISTFTGLSSRLQSVSTCPELESDLDLDRARGLRPSKETCSTCPDADTCTSPVACSKMPSSRPESRSDGAEGPAFSPTATDLETSTAPPRESSPARECGVTIAKIQASRANARRKNHAARPSRPTRLMTSANAKTPNSRPALPSRSGSLANHALKGVANHVSSQRDEPLRIADGELRSRTSHLVPSIL